MSDSRFLFFLGADGWKRDIESLCIYIQYDCSSQIANLDIEWLGKTALCQFASIVVFVNRGDEEDRMWKLKLAEINSTRERLQSAAQGSNSKEFDEKIYELNKFNEDLGKKLNS